ncbi:histidinol-phosphate transaminase [Snodgrassella communis]|uniref:Histidinol-phosphate aminotransferase n=1 Tax=Snodgrassella communis TaxID=2946699 RepID=A0A836MRA9_9NEIS|nr:histidinol-phosphate transaminase [Snodgrassella communis]KDN14788.1 Histidinol-phosphate aminotransferase [Snodgrassella communis]PIT07500.1 histidinol-phosphate transaminase [Snodgrassella communis]PIT28094.1 histidinol-phosphate transaminase [Snodgrassella communis]PIT30188.1 histidinol-phosphate transaminase [Snodgrassella communis]PIT37959.1 histidinol-phosphate transaminase [Snodgrassella communis]
MSKFWSEKTKCLQPYVPGEQPKLTNLVKLNTNENPFPPSPNVLAAMQEAINDDLRLYPDPNAEKLKQTIADYYGLHKQQVFVGNGSDEVLAHAFAAFFQGKQQLLLPDISYSFYPVYCQLYGVEACYVPLNVHFAINPADYCRARAGVIFPNPNAPTGCILPMTQVEQILQANPDCVVLVDEAYIDFGGESAIRLIDDYPNLLVVQTLSKSRSLAGMRIGLAMGHTDLIEGLERVKNSFNSYPLDRVAQAAAIAAFTDDDYFRITCAKVIENRIWLVAQLQRLEFEVLSSEANFVFARHSRKEAIQIAGFLRQHGVVVRHFQQERISNFLRISVGTQEQQQRLVMVLEQMLM